jgi:acetyl coenzyme A synthetase (ADP forming)-like protein
MTLHPAEPPWPALGEPGFDRLILRDGSVAAVRPATTVDREALRRFFDDLSPESRRQRFLGVGSPSDELITRFADSSRPNEQLTLVAWREIEGALRPIAVASYVAIDAAVAEAAFAVADRWQGKGLATALLERLAVAATSQGFRSLEASTLPGNHAMLEVFRDSGFTLRSKSEQGVVEVRLDLVPSATNVAAIDRRNKLATVTSLRPLLTPASVAVVGASRSPGQLGRRILDALIEGDFRGPVYPVNPHADSIGTVPCYPSLTAIPGSVDLAVIVVPSRSVIEAVDDCAAAGVRSLVVISAGFAETGPEGRLLQRRLLEKVRGLGVRMVGPNCMGILNADPAVRLNASIASRLSPSGRIAVATQSGGLGLALLELATARRIGLSTFVSLGNKADVSGNDLLQYGEADPRTSVILLYLESLGNPRRFAQLARRVGATKPVVVVKAGRTAAGSRAAGSHTAGLASNEAAVTALMRQCGVIRVDTIDEMFDVAACLDLQPLPAGSRTAILTNAGGPGILAADACETAGLEVAELSEETRARLAARLPAHASLRNPVDLIASAGPDLFRHAVETVLAAPEVQALVVIQTPVDRSRTGAIWSAVGEGIAAARQTAAGKPVLACTMTAAAEPLVVGTETIPAYSFPENAIRALGRSAAYAAWRRQPPALFWTFDDVHVETARSLCRSVLQSRGDSWLTPEELDRLLAAFAIPVVSGTVARSEEEAIAVAGIAGYPVALKLSAPDVLHKTEAGGVRLNLDGPGDVEAAFADIARRFPSVRQPGSASAVLVQPMVTGTELLVGLTDDPTFGPLVAFGLGGIDTEVLRDVAFRVAPLTDRDADDLLHGIRSLPLLQGHRGRPPADVDALRHLLLRVSLIGQHVPEIRELDLNPVIALPAGQGCRVVDARARVAPDQPA